MKATKFLLLCALTCSIAAPAAFAGDPDEKTIKEAQGYFEKGDTAYNLGRFDDAVIWFTKAYETWPVPDFLYNIAQSYRQAGNCKQSLYFYKRYKSLKEKDKTNPLSKKEKAEVDRFIGELTECAAKADDTATTPPDTLKGGGDTDTTPDTTTTVPDTTTQPDTTTEPDTTTTPDTTVATTEEPDPDPEDELMVEEGTVAPKLLSARITGGLAVIGAGGASDMKVPPQSSFAVEGGYPLPVGPMLLDLGAGLSFSSVSYNTMTTSESASLLGVRAIVGATYPINDKIGVRGALGLGIVSLGGLKDGNPFAEDRAAASYTMLNVRFGVSAEYAITPNIVATLAPFSFGFSPAPEEAHMDSLTEIDVHVGVGYRM